MAHPIKNFKLAAIATDVVILTIKNKELQVLLIEMTKKPYIGNWAVPGGMVHINESVDNSAKRHLLTKTGVKDIYLEQIYTFGAVKRDPYGRVVSVAYFALIPSDNLKIETSEEYSDIQWFPVSKLPKLAYDHSEIIKTAIDRLKSKLEYTNIVCNLMPKEFSLSDLQSSYEIILNKIMDKRNFRKKILSLKLIKKTGRLTSGEANRPAELYSFIQRKPQIVEIL
jgi:8-oxo-dGTP diphosphatase